LRFTVRPALGALALSAALAFATASATLGQAQFAQAKLESFVTAAIAVNELIQEWTARINDAETETQASEMRDEANAKLAAAIEQTEGMTIDEYREISQALRTDADLQARVSEIYQQRTTQ
jgi:hypothetical protein